MNDSAWKAVYFALIAFLAIVICTSLLSLMAAFMGGDPSQGRLPAANTLQIWGAGLSVVLIGFACALFATRTGLYGIRGAWDHTPGWLAFGAGSLISLSIMGELSYFLLRDSELLGREWVNHVALAALTLSSLAICCLAALRNALSGRPPFAKERW